MTEDLLVLDFQNSKIIRLILLITLYCKKCAQSALLIMVQYE